MGALWGQSQRVSRIKVSRRAPKRQAQACLKPKRKNSHTNALRRLEGTWFSSRMRISWKRVLV
jgi:hypothetical protein